MVHRDTCALSPSPALIGFAGPPSPERTPVDRHSATERLHRLRRDAGRLGGLHVDATLARHRTQVARTDAEALLEGAAEMRLAAKTQRERDRADGLGRPIVGIDRLVAALQPALADIGLHAAMFIEHRI